MKDHYSLATISKKCMVNAFDLSPEEAKLVHRYRIQLPVIYDSEGKEGFCIDAEVLHKQLKSKARFRDWLRSIKKYFNEDDFCEFFHESSGGRKAVGAMVTVDVSKQMAMLEKSDTGMMVRKYFILCERLILRMAKRNPIRQNCKDSTSGLFNNIVNRVPAGKRAKVMAEMHAMICTVATGQRPSVWKKMLNVENVRDYLKENAKVHELKRYDEVAQMAEMLSRDVMQTKKTITKQLESSFGESEIYYNHLHQSGVKEF